MLLPEEFRTLFLNLQYLLNMLRPYQAREELIGLVEGQIEEKRRLIKELGGACDACVVGGVGGRGHDGWQTSGPRPLKEP